MKTKAILFTLLLTLMLGLSPIAAYAIDGNEDAGLVQGVSLLTQSTADAKPMNLSPKYSAYLTNGKKGSAYKTYTSYPFTGSGVIYKARISGSKLILNGTYKSTGGTLSKPAKMYKAKNKKFKLTAKTKYYQHVGNNNYYLKSSKTKIKKLISSKSANEGGDISFTVKSGKVTLLIAQ